MTRPWRGMTHLVAVAVALHCVVSLVRRRRELATVRAELAAAVAERERLSASGDALGQTLSAVSLKGDLAVQLLGRDPAAARDEVAGIAELARLALHEVRARTADELVASLRPGHPLRRGETHPPPRG